MAAGLQAREQSRATRAEQPARTFDNSHFQYIHSIMADGEVRQKRTFRKYTFRGVEVGLDQICQAGGLSWWWWWNCRRALGIKQQAASNDGCRIRRIEAGGDYARPCIHHTWTPAWLDSMGPSFTNLRSSVTIARQPPRHVQRPVHGDRSRQSTKTLPKRSWNKAPLPD